MWQLGLVDDVDAPPIVPDPNSAILRAIHFHGLAFFGELVLAVVSFLLRVRVFLYKTFVDMVAGGGPFFSGVVGRHP